MSVKVPIVRTFPLNIQIPCAISLFITAQAQPDEDPAVIVPLTNLDGL